MIPISEEEEEEEIDNIDKNLLFFERGNKRFSVTMRDIYCYGQIDFNDKNTIEKINDFNFLDYLGASGIPIYSNYNYTTHSCYTPKRYCLYTETWSPLDLVKLAHGYLGKPQRILLFRQIVK